MSSTTGEGPDPPQKDTGDISSERGERLPPREALSLLVPDANLVSGAAAGDLAALTGSESTSGGAPAQADPAFVQSAQDAATEFVDAEASETSDASAVEGDRSETFTSSDSASAES